MKIIECRVTIMILVPEKFEKTLNLLEEKKKKHSQKNKT